MHPAKPPTQVALVVKCSPACAISDGKGLIRGDLGTALDRSAYVWGGVAEVLAKQACVPHVGARLRVNARRRERISSNVGWCNAVCSLACSM